MLTVLGRATSSNVQALMWGLAELGVSVKRLDKGENFGGLDMPEFRAQNPHGKIPVLLVEDGTAIFETAAILRYLANRFGDSAFWPADAMARARVDMWAEWAKHDVAEAFTGPVFWRVVRMRAENRDQTAIRQAIDKLEHELAIAEPRLAASAYLCGGTLTLADIQFGHVLYRYFDIDIDRRVFPNLRAYYDRLANRAAYRDTVMLPYDVLRDTI